MTMMNALARTTIAVAQVTRVGDAAALVGHGLLQALEAVPEGDATGIDHVLADHARLGKLLEDLSSDVPSRSKAESDMDNLIAGIGGMQGLADTALAGFGTVLSSQFQSWDNDALAPNVDQDATAALLVMAMLKAVLHRSDFSLADRAVIMAQVDAVGEPALTWVSDRLDRRVSAGDVARQIPPWLEPQAYFVSVLGIGLAEASGSAYLKEMLDHLALSQATVDKIHDQLGVPPVDMAA